MSSGKKKITWRDVPLRIRIGLIFFIIGNLSFFASSGELISTLIGMTYILSGIILIASS